MGRTPKSNGNLLQGRALAIMRLSRGMSRPELCRAARIAPGNLSEYQRGVAWPRREPFQAARRPGSPARNVERAKHTGFGAASRRLAARYARLTSTTLTAEPAVLADPAARPPACYSAISWPSEPRTIP
jgi:hypothetical protein